MWHDTWELHEINISAPVTTDLLSTACLFVHMLSMWLWQWSTEHRRPQLHCTRTRLPWPHAAKPRDSPSEASWPPPVLTCQDFFFSIASASPSYENKKRRQEWTSNAEILRHGSWIIPLLSCTARHLWALSTNVIHVLRTHYTRITTHSTSLCRTALLRRTGKFTTGRISTAKLLHKNKRRWKQGCHHAW